VNKQGHTENLVPAHPGNRNAQKSGVHSPRALAERTAEVSAASADVPSEQLVEDRLRELADRFKAHGAAIDEDLKKNGLTGRGGEARTMVTLLHRAGDKERRILEALDEVIERRRAAQAPPVVEVPQDHERPVALHEEVARAHYRESLADVSPEYFDADTFLACISDSDDPGVTFNDRAKASKLLTQAGNDRHPRCTCHTTLTARNAIEMRDWIREWQTRIRPSGADPLLAALVRTIARGDTANISYPHHRMTIQAVETVKTDAAAGPAGPTPARVQTDRTVMRFWQILLSDDPAVTPKRRLQAFATLRDAGAFAPCTCPATEPLHLQEARIDNECASIVKTLVKKNLRAAETIAQYPETFTALQDLTDDALLATATAEPKVLEP
jgi:hypothetical protein